LRTLLLGGVIGCAAGAAAIVWVARHALHAQFDRSLLARAEFIASLVDYSDKSEVECDDVAGGTREYVDEETPDYFQVWLLDGDGKPASTLARSESLEQRETDLSLAPPPDVETPVFGSVPLPDGRVGRSVTILSVVEEADDELEESERQRLLALRQRIVVTIAAGRGSVGALLVPITFGVLAAEAVMMLGLAGLSVFAVRRGLRPLRRAGEEVSAIDAADLGARLHAAQAPEEVRPLLSGVNSLLDRLEGSFERERVSRAMLAHELRNPIAALLSAAEVAKKWEDDPDLVRRQLDRVVEDARSLRRLVDTLLRVARVQGGQHEPQWERVDFARMVAEVVAASEALGASRGVGVSVESPAALPVRSDADLLRIVVSNVLGNAFEHTPRAGRIDVRLSSEGDRVQLVCANTITPGATIDTTQIWTPFRTGDARCEGDGSSDGERSHLGLGLAAAKSICAAIGASVRVDIEREWFIARVEAPRSA
jgi:signal transduction histidine kinase